MKPDSGIDRSEAGFDAVSTARPITEPSHGHLWRPFSPPPGPVLDESVFTFVKGQGVWLEDRVGRRYLDGVGALEAMAVGHGRSELAEVAARQMRELAFLDVFRHVSEPALALADTLVRISPPGLEYVSFTPGGSEAVEVALKLTLQYHWLRGEPQRRHVICRNGAFHGVTFGAMNCDGDYHATRNDIYLGSRRFGSVARGQVAIEGWGRGARHAAGADDFEAELMRLGPENVAAIVVDPIGTASGVACAPPEDLRQIRQLCDEHGVLLVVDEVITGFCRTGAMFASELYDVRPDLMPVSKALSSGYMPIGATLISARLAEPFARASERDAIFAHGHTYSGHPVACAVALENIRILEEENLAEVAAEKGPQLRKALAGVAAHDAVVDVRGVGMISGVEILTGDKEAGAFGTARAAVTWLRKRCGELGLITLPVHPGTVLLLAPPLIITDSEIESLATILTEAIEDLEARL